MIKNLKHWCWKWDKLCETQLCETQLWVSLPLPLMQFLAKFKLELLLLALFADTNTQTQNTQMHKCQSYFYNTKGKSCLQLNLTIKGFIPSPSPPWWVIEHSWDCWFPTNCNSDASQITNTKVQIHKYRNVNCNTQDSWDCLFLTNCNLGASQIADFALQMPPALPKSLPGTNIFQNQEKYLKRQIQLFSSGAFQIADTSLNPHSIPPSTP